MVSLSFFAVRFEEMLQDEALRRLQSGEEPLDYPGRAPSWGRPKHLNARVRLHRLRPMGMSWLRFKRFSAATSVESFSRERR